MKNTDILLTDQYSEIYSEEYHIIGTAALLVAWAWLGTVIIG
jgi:hypothetical protein